MSADGTKFIACVEYGRIFVYDGESWTETQPIGDQGGDWRLLDMSADGTKFITGYYGGRLYTYDGESWTE